MPETTTAIAYLRSPLAIRARCETILQAGIAGKLEHFSIDLGALPNVVDKVIAAIQTVHPELTKVPLHGRINHFRAGGIDRVPPFEARLAALPMDERLRSWVDLIVVSVLLDADAGASWRYREPGTDLVIGRSEGLALASLHAFEAGVFSSDPGNLLSADIDGLRALDPGRLADAFQIADDNPLAGVDRRIALIRDLGTAIAANSTMFPGGRPGGLVDHLRARGSAINASQILTAILEGLGSIWPGRVELDGINLGDVWRHPAAGGTGPSEGLVPFHKSSQWIAYSLFEPLERCGVTVTHTGALTGLSEYRNGGLFVDLGVAVPKHDDAKAKIHELGEQVIVEWRALTIALLDRVTEAVQHKLGKTPAEMPLARVLEGTWAAGRAAAAAARPGGGSPIRVHTNGNVF
ncbi:MAG: DUF1688 family protein [Kofleriaceae bacterium]